MSILYVELGLIAFFFLVLFILFQLPPLNLIMKKSSMWEQSFYAILFFSSSFFMVERFFPDMPLRMGFLKAIILAFVLFAHPANKILTGNKYSFDRVFLLIFIFFVTGYTAVALSDYIGNRIEFDFLFFKTTQYIFYPMLAFFAYNEFKGSNGINNYVKVVLIIAIIAAVIGMIQFIAGPGWLKSIGMQLEIRSQVTYISGTASKVFRIFSICLDHQSYAALLLWGIICLLIISNYLKNKWALLVLIFFLVSILTTYSNTILGAAILILLTYVLIKFMYEKKMNVVGGLLLVSVILSVTVFTFRNAAIREGMLNPERKSYLSRFSAFNNGLTILFENPLKIHGMSEKNLNSLGTTPDCYMVWSVLQFGLVLSFLEFLLYIYPVFIMSQLLRRNKDQLPDEKKNMIYLMCSFFVVNAFFLNMSNNLMFTGPSNLIFWTMVGITSRRSFWLSSENKELTEAK